MARGDAALNMHIDGLTLRRYQPNDLDQLVALDNDPEVMRYINGGIAISKARYEETILPIFTSPVEPPFGYWIAETKSLWVGWFCLNERGPGEAELGYRLARDAWGQGLATLGATRLSEAGFAAGLTCVYANTYEHNSGSRRVLEKIGMQLTKRFRWTPDMASDSAEANEDIWEGDDLRFEMRQP